MLRVEVEAENKSDAFPPAYKKTALSPSRLPHPKFTERMEPLNLQHLLTHFSDHWSQRTIGTFNDYEIKLAKLLGEFVWHSHPDTDDLFLIIYGTLNIQLRDRDVTLNSGDVFVVPSGVEHVRKNLWPFSFAPALRLGTKDKRLIELCSGRKQIKR